MSLRTHLTLTLTLILVAQANHHRRHHANWRIVAIPADEDQPEEVIGDLLSRLHVLHTKDEVFDTPTTQPPPTLPVQRESGSQLFHPFMRMLDNEIDERRNEKWIEMDVQGKPNIRGIEPITVTELEVNKTFSLTFSVGPISNMDSIHHVDLVLTTLDHWPPPFLRGPTSLLVDLQTDNLTSLPISLQTFRKSFSTDDNRKWSFLSLEMTPTIKRWWTSGFLREATPTIRVSGLHWKVQRPLLVFYYVTNRVSRMRRSSGVAYGGFRPQPSPKQANQGIAFGQVKSPKVNETKVDNHLCSHRNWSVTIQELNWDILIIYPLTLQINYCAGACDAPMDEFTMNAYARSSLLLSNNYNNTRALPVPFCVPTALDRQKVVLATNKTSIQITYMDSLIATQCGCR